MLENFIKKLSLCLDEERIPYMIIGGQAVLLYGIPRLTRDIDVTLGVDTDKISLVKNVCKKIDLKILPKNPDSFARETKVLPTENKKIKMRVDFIFSFTPYERQAIKRAKKVLIDGYGVKFASCEDVIIHKMFAGRVIDIEDVKNILIKNRNKINLEYVKRWLSLFSKIAEQKTILIKFNNLLKQI